MSFSTHDARGLQCFNRSNISERIWFQYPRCTWIVVKQAHILHRGLAFQYPRCTWIVVSQIAAFSGDRAGFQYPRCTWIVVAVFNVFVRRVYVLVPTMHVDCSSRWNEPWNCSNSVLVPTMHVDCSADWTFVCPPDYSFSTHDARGLQSSGRALPARRIPTVLVPTMHVDCSSEICTKAVSLCSYFITMCCICQVLFPINFRFFILFFCSICFSSDFLVRIPLFHPSNRRENQEFRGTIFYYYLLKCNYF